MCFEREWNEGSSDNTRAPWLSHPREVGLLWGKSRPLSNARNHIASFVVSQAATYSASHEDVVTIFCFLAAQETRPDPSVKQYLDIERRVSIQLPQSESVNPARAMSWLPPRYSFMVRVPFRYRTMCLAASQCSNE